MDQEENDKICVSMLIGRRFEAARASLGLTKIDLVAAVQRVDPKFSKTQLHRLLTGEADWSLSRYVLTARALGEDPAMLLDEVLRGVDGQSGAT